MKHKFEALDGHLYGAGKVVKRTGDGAVQLPVTKDGMDQDMLCVVTEEGYRLIRLAPDVRRIYIEVTTKCNFDCITCIRSTWRDCLEHMTWQTFENLLASMRDLPDLTSVHFGGFGEPMMHPRIFDMIEAVKDLDIIVEMISNGSYLTEKNIEKLLNLELDILYTSLDSPDEEAYNDIRPGADFNSVTDNVRRLQRMKAERKTEKPALGIEFVAMKQNFHQLPDLIALARDLKATEIIVSNLIPYHESMKEEIVYDMDDEEALFGKEGLKTTIFAKVSNMKLRTDRYCKFVKDKTLSVNYEGQVSPCYPLMHHYDSYIYGRKKEMMPLYMGCVNDTHLKDIWMDSGYVNFRRIIGENQFPSCLDCKYQDGCSYTESNEMDCWGNSPSCGECLWARRIIACP